MRIVTNKRIRHLPVVDEGELKGMVSIGDLVKAIISSQAYTIDQLHTYIGNQLSLMSGGSPFCIYARRLSPIRAHTPRHHRSNSRFGGALFLVRTKVRYRSK